MLIYVLKQNKMKPGDLAKELGVSLSQIYKWDKEGISEDNPHWNEIHKRFPGIPPKQPKLTKKKLKDGRGRAGRKKKKLTLQETNLPSYQEPQFKSKRFPNISFED